MCVGPCCPSPQYPPPKPAVQSVEIFAAPVSYKNHKNRLPRCGGRRIRAPAGRGAAPQTGRLQPWAVKLKEWLTLFSVLESGMIHTILRLLCFSSKFNSSTWIIFNSCEPSAHHRKKCSSRWASHYLDLAFSCLHISQTSPDIFKNLSSSST